MADLSFNAKNGIVANGIFIANSTTTQGNGFVTNSTGMYITGVVNATSIQVGSSDVINSTGIFTSGIVNATTVYVGSVNVNTAITSNAATAYSNATTYSATQLASNIATVNTAITGNAATAYTNATTYAATIAGTAYSNAISYAATIAGTAYSNAVANAAALYYPTTNPYGFANSTNSNNINGNAYNITQYTINQNLGTSNSPTFNNAYVSGTVAMGSSFLRNRIINGNMAIDQRNAGAVTSSQGYCVDRWAFGSTSGTLTAQQTGTIGNNSLTITATSSVTLLNVYQRIEAANIADLAGTKVTVSFIASSNAITSLIVGVGYANSLNNFTTTTSIATNTISITSTPTLYSMQFTLPSSAANGIYFNVANGMTLANGNTLVFSNVQLEAGSVATPFERRQIGTELALCQRYFETSYNLGTAPGTATATGMGMGYVSGPTGFNAGGIYFQFKVSKRTTPTMVSYSYASGAPGYIRDAVNNVDVSASWSINGASGAFVQGLMSASSNYVNFQGQYTASAEL